MLETPIADNLNNTFEILRNGTHIRARIDYNTTILADLRALKPNAAINKLIAKYDAERDTLFNDLKKHAARR